MRGIRRGIVLTLSNREFEFIYFHLNFVSTKPAKIPRKNERKNRTKAARKGDNERSAMKKSLKKKIGLQIEKIENATPLTTVALLQALALNV